MPNKILDDLIAAKVPSDTILAVAELIAQAEVNRQIEAENSIRRAKNAERMRNVRARARTCKHVQTPPPAYTTPPKKIEPKKVLSMPIPSDWLPDLEFAKARGWPTEYAQAEVQRFRDHALAKGRRCKDWQAAWRNWVTSPFQQTLPVNGHQATGGTDDEFERRPGESLGSLGRRLADEARRREHAAGIARPDDSLGERRGGD